MEGLALVTGATRGIGRVVTLELLRRGYRVVATGRNDVSLRELQEDVEDELLETALVDLDSADVADQARTAIGGRPLALLVLNAARFAPWDETAGSADLTAADSIVRTNLFGSWAVLQAALPALREARGTVIAVGSGAGSHGDPDFGLAANPGAASYAVSKAALHALMHKVAREVADDGITVHITDPGLTATAPGMEEMGARRIWDGALSVLAPLGTAIASGSFTRDGRPLPW